MAGHEEAHRHPVVVRNIVRLLVQEPRHVDRATLVDETGVERDRQVGQDEEHDDRAVAQTQPSAGVQHFRCAISFRCDVTGGR